VCPILRQSALCLSFLGFSSCIRPESNPPARAIPTEAAPEPEAAASETIEEPPLPGEEQFSWQTDTRSPRGSQSAAHRDLARLCDERDGALDRVAARLAQRVHNGLPPLDPSEIHFSLRAEGSPYVWARAWSLDGRKLAPGDVRARVERWLGGFDDGGRRRCGFALHAGGGREVMYAVAADALADVEPLPTSARSGQWLNVRAKMLVAASDAKVIVLGPRGGAKTVTTSFSDAIVRASFSVDSPGTWTVQVVAVVDGGPRPVAEATVSVDVLPPRTARAHVAPGERAAEGVERDDDALFAMLNAARSAEGARPLARDPRLDQIASDHALAMQSARRLGHDVGGGSAANRMRAAKLAFRAAGENVARAASIRRAHRALWASPSHRGNLLDPRFSAVGVGAVRDPDGSVWACQVFAAWR
jgi:uncharacterized protein YkwD